MLWSVFIRIDRILLCSPCSSQSTSVLVTCWYRGVPFNNDAVEVDGLMAEKDLGLLFYPAKLSKTFKFWHFGQSKSFGSVERWISFFHQQVKIIFLMHFKCKNQIQIQRNVKYTGMHFVAFDFAILLCWNYILKYLLLPPRRRYLHIKNKIDCCKKLQCATTTSLEAN